MRKNRHVRPGSIQKSSKIDKADKGKGETYVLQLFIAGLLPNSSQAVENIKAICETYLKGRYKLEIVDIYQQPDLALSEDIIALPILIKKSPLPEGRLIGNLSNTEEVLKGLHLN